MTKGIKYINKTLLSRTWNKRSRTNLVHLVEVTCDPCISKQHETGVINIYQLGMKGKTANSIDHVFDIYFECAYGNINCPAVKGEVVNPHHYSASSRDSTGIRIDAEELLEIKNNLIDQTKEEMKKQSK